MRGLCPPARLMSSVKDNVGRGLNIALVNGEPPWTWGLFRLEKCSHAVTCHPSAPCGGIWVFASLHPSENSQGSLGRGLCKLKAPQKKRPNEQKHGSSTDLQVYEKLGGASWGAPGGYSMQGRSSAALSGPQLSEQAACMGHEYGGCLKHFQKGYIL